MFQASAKIMRPQSLLNKFIFRIVNLKCSSCTEKSHLQLELFAVIISNEEIGSSSDVHKHSKRVHTFRKQW
jgi:hypothetical protein